MSFRETTEKFRECADFANWPAAKAAAVIDAVAHLGKAPDMSRLTAALTV